MAFFERQKTARCTQGVATHMTFRVGEQRYGVPIGMISEVIALSGLAPYRSEGDEAVIGQIELRGSVLTVVDMGVRLAGAPIVPSGQSCVLIVRRDRARSGCLFDAVEGLERVPLDQVELSGCLVEAADGAITIPSDDAQSPESTSSGGLVYGHSLYKTDSHTLWLPAPEAFYTR